MAYPILALSSAFLLLAALAYAEDPSDSSMRKTRLIGESPDIIDIVIPIVPGRDYEEISLGSDAHPFSDAQPFMDIKFSYKYLPLARANRALERRRALCYLGGTLEILEAYIDAPLVASVPLNKVSWYIVAPPGEDAFTDVDQLGNKTVGVMTGIEPEHHVRNHELITFIKTSKRNLVKMLIAKRIDAAILDSDLNEATRQQLVIDERYPIAEYRRSLNCLANSDRGLEVLEAFNRAYLRSKQSAKLEHTSEPI